MTTTTIAGTTDAEAKVLAATAAAIEAGQDPFGDEDEDTAAEAAADAGDEGEDHADEGETQEVPGDPEQAPAAEAAADEPPIIGNSEDAPSEPRAPRYNAGDPASFAAQRAELTAQKAKALKDLMDGTIEPEAYSAIESEVADKLDALTVQRTLHEANVQTEAQVQSSVIDGIIAAAKKSGEVDYAADAVAAKRFDAEMQLLAQDGTKRTFAEMAAEAHANVLAVRGVKKAEPSATKEPAKPRENGKGPMTLRNLPAAAVPNSGGGWQEELASLSGQAYEDAFSRLSPAQRAQLLND